MEPSKAAYANEVAVVTVFPALLSRKKPHGNCNRELSGKGAVLGRWTADGHS